MGKVLNYLIGFYIGISSIYWFPGIAVDELRNFKYLVYGIIIALGVFLLPALKIKQIPKGIFGLSGLFLLLILYIPSILLSNQEVAFETISNILSFYLFIWVIYLLLNNSLINLIIISKIVINIMMIFVIFHITGSLFFKNIPIPEQKVSYISFQDISFNLSRTGWSNGMALFVPFCFLFKTDIKKWVLIFLILYSQFLSGGRSGLLASLFIVFLYFLIQGSFKKFALLISTIVFLVISNLELVVSQLRIDRLESGYGGDTLNQFSSDRVVGYVYGIQQWMDNPVFGKGIKNVNIEAIAFVDEIHNFWIKTLAESGTIVFLFYIVFIALIFKNINAINNKKEIFIIFLLLIIAGIIETMFEPNVIFGSFQNSAVWWLGVAVILSNSNKIQNQVN
jgi:hypothetical protein